MSSWTKLPIIKNTCVMGADNGKSGFLVFLNLSGDIVHIEQYPNDAKRLYDLINHFRPTYATIESVFMAAGFKSVASTNFEIMGRYMQTFELLDIPYEATRAVSWRNKLNLKAKGRENQKLAAIEYASKIFSKKDYNKLMTKYNRINKQTHHKEEFIEPDNNKCESALIAYYTLQKYLGKF